MHLHQKWYSYTKYTVSLHQTDLHVQHQYAIQQSSHETSIAHAETTEPPIHKGKALLAVAS